jgi:serine/threonine-protein kinase RsbT
MGDPDRCVMAILREQSFELKSEEDVVRARQLVRKWAADCQFSLIEQTKLVTATSELARNTVIYGGGGTMFLAVVTEGFRTGLRAVFEDHGPGIPNLELALKDGYTTGDGLGLGLGGAKRLVNQFEIQSQVGQGTKVTIVRWK